MVHLLQAQQNNKWVENGKVIGCLYLCKGHFFFLLITIMMCQRHNGDRLLINPFRDARNLQPFSYQQRFCISRSLTCLDVSVHILSKKSLKILSDQHEQLPTSVWFVFMWFDANKPGVLAKSSDYFFHRKTSCINPVDFKQDWLIEKPLCPLRLSSPKN